MRNLKNAHFHGSLHFVSSIIKGSFQSDFETFALIFAETTHSIHVDAVCVGPGVLEVLLQPLSQSSWDLMETDELFDPQHLGVVAGCA